MKMRNILFGVIGLLIMTIELYNQNTPVDLKDRVVFFARNRELSLFMGNNFTSLPSPNSFGYFLKTNTALKNWRAGTWHHIAFKWKKIGNSYKVGPVYLDGTPSFNTYQSEFAFNPIHFLFFGTNRFKDMVSNGYPLTADSTIQSIRIYKDSNIVDPSGNQGYLIPDRYSPTQRNTYEGTIFDFAAKGAPTVKTIKILGISWTERIPSSGGDLLIDLKVVRPKQVTEFAEDPYDVVKEWTNLGKDDGPDFCYDSGGVKIEHSDVSDCWSRQGVEIGLQAVPNTTANEYISIRGNEKIIIKAKFKLPQTAPVLESPHLEDVTISIITGDPKTLRSWEESKANE